jgi:type VI secretion system secreted protein Hcp
MAQVDYFLKIDGIEGEATDAKHGKEIDIDSWSVGLTNSGEAGSRGGLGSGKAVFNDFHFVMRVSKASPKLFEACACGTHVKSAILTCRKAGGEQQEYLKYTFTTLLISSYQAGGSTGGVIPTDQISFNYAKMEMEYKEQKPDGTLGGAVKSGYDLAANKKV